MEGSIASVSYASIVVIAISTIPSTWRLVKRRRVKPTNDGKLFEDADGVATEESMARYSAKPFYTVALSVAIVGVATSLALAIYSTVKRDKGFTKLCLTQVWLLSASWVRSSRQP